MSINLTIYSVEDLLLCEELLENARKANNKKFSFNGRFGLAIKDTSSNVINFLHNYFAGYTIISPKPDLIVARNDGESYFIMVQILPRVKYISINFDVWTQDPQMFKKFENAIREIYKKNMATGPICGMNWAFRSQHGLTYHFLEELIEETIYDDAYPVIKEKWGSVDNFIKEYIKSDSSILILQGKPGVGKSRFIRYFLSRFVLQNEISHIKMTGSPDVDASGGHRSSVLYSTDQRLFESDEVFARFISSEERIFIVEDADHVLKPRSDGNKDLHRFLTISDGIFRAVGKKLIFTTNLPNIGDIDEALIRKGRCFAHLNFGTLSYEKTVALANKINPNRTSQFDHKKSYTLAEIYDLVNNG